MSASSLSRRVMDRHLDRTRVLAQVRRGERSRSSILDATPSLIASAEVLGESIDADCPVCGQQNLRLTRWIHGLWLGEKSGTARNVTEIQKLIEDFAALETGADAELSIHTVEVCLHCKWNFLTQHEVLTLR